MTETPVGLRISVVMPAEVKSSSRQIMRFARHVEDLGLDGIFVGDHLAAATAQPDSTLILAVAATATERVALGFGVMVLALRGPAWAAKQIATLQTLSADRIILGVGVGGEVHGTSAWQAMGIAFTERGSQTDAALRVLPDLVTGVDTMVGPGAQLQLSPAALMPPVWIGGMSRAAQRRAAVFGDAWFPSMMLATQLSAARRRLHDLAEQHGRPEPALALGAAVLDPAQPDVAHSFVRALTDGYGIPAERARNVPLTGTAHRLAERLAEYAETGVEHLVVGLVGNGWQSQCDLLVQARAALPDV